MREKKRLQTACAKAVLWAGNRIFPLCFVFSSTLNLVFFYLGFAYEENAVRHYGFIIGNLLFALLCGLAALSALRRRRPPLRVWPLMGLVLGFFVVYYIQGFLLYGFHDDLIQYAEEFIVFALPSFFAGIYGALERKEGTFLQTLESLSLLIVPGALIYANSVIFNCCPWGYNSYLGVIGYMTLAYTFMPYLLALLLRFGSEEPFLLFGRAIRRPQLARGLLIALLWAAIIASATRGAFVSILLFCLILCLSRLLRRELARPTVLVSLTMAGILCFNLFVYTPPGLYRLESFNLFLEHLIMGRLDTAFKENPEIEERLDELVAAENGKQVANREEEPGEETEHNDIADENYEIGNRGTLFKLAVEEFLKAPVTGMGMGGYTVKYGMYPHTALLELLCETGLIGSLILLPLILYVLIRLLLAGRKNRYIHYFLLFIVAFAFKVNISGCLWTCGPLLCALGYGIALPVAGSTGEEE